MTTELGVLERILAVKHEEVTKLKSRGVPADFKRRALEVPGPRDFLAALKNHPRIPVIAEIKRASPSAGAIREAVDPAALALDYQAGGAAALSVLTDKTFFSGSLKDLALAREAADLPVLRKDFILDRLQLYEARSAGADAVLLIAAALDRDRLGDLYLEALELGLTPLIEVHDQEELPPVLNLKPDLIGINNRDLKTMKVDLGTSLELRKMIPAETMVVAESGVSSPAEVLALRRGGLDAFLIGSALMRAPDPKAALASLCRAEAA